jgi:hypothetical protein
MVAGAFPHTSIGHDAHLATASRRPTGRSGDIDSNTILDVCIFGSGFAGAIWRIPGPTGYKNGHSLVRPCPSRKVD